MVGFEVGLSVVGLDVDGFWVGLLEVGVEVWPPSVGLDEVGSCEVGFRVGVGVGELVVETTVLEVVDVAAVIVTPASV